MIISVRCVQNNIANRCFKYRKQAAPSVLLSFHFPPSVQNHACFCRSLIDSFKSGRTQGCGSMFVHTAANSTDSTASGFNSKSWPLTSLLPQTQPVIWRDYYVLYHKKIYYGKYSETPLDEWDFGANGLSKNIQLLLSSPKKISKHIECCRGKRSIRVTLMYFPQDSKRDEQRNNETSPLCINERTGLWFSFVLCYL